MKNLVLISIVVFLFSSCSKDKLVEKNKNIYSEISSTGQYNVTLDTLGWLVFNDRKHIMSTLDQLELSTDNYDIRFEDCLSQIPDNYTYEQEQSAIQQCGYVEDKPTLDFVNSFGGGYTSIYQKIENDIDNWVSQQTPPINFTNMPSHDLDDPILGAVYNQYGEVQVGDIVYFTKSDGRQIGIKRSYLTYEIVQNLRTLFADPNFDPTSYPSTSVTNQTLINEFLYGEQIGGGAITQTYNVQQATVTILLAPIVFIYDLEKWNYSPGGDCYMEKTFPINDWNGSNRTIKFEFRVREYNVLGKWWRAQSRCYENDKKRLANMKIDGECRVWNIDENMHCTTITNLYTQEVKEKNRKKLNNRRVICLYRRYGIHRNDSSQNYIYCYFYKDGRQIKYVH